MKEGRREFVAALGAAASYALFPSDVAALPTGKMYGLIGRMTSVEGKRDELIKHLLDGSDRMPGCLSYIVAKDPNDANGIWITEVWDRQESHAASLNLPSVKESIKKARPLVAGFHERFTTEPLGGHGLSKK